MEVGRDSVMICYIVRGHLEPSSLQLRPSLVLNCQQTKEFLWQPELNLYSPSPISMPVLMTAIAMNSLKENSSCLALLESHTNVFLTISKWPLVYISTIIRSGSLFPGRELSS